MNMKNMNGQDQFEVKELICDQLCVACESWHRCFDDKSDEEFRGINLKGITGVFDMKKQMFPCDYCNFKSNNMEKVLQHFKTKHEGCYKISCWVCSTEVKTMEELKKHIGTYHYTPKHEHDDD